VGYYYRLRSIQRHHLESAWMWFVPAIVLMTRRLGKEDVLSAVQRATSAGWTAVRIRNVPDSTQGAYVFRNGLAEAIAPATLTSAAPPVCWLSVPFAN
jgi:hypothetical protein